MALCGKVVYFVRLYLFHHLQDTHRVAEVGIVEVEIRMPLQVGDTLTVVHRRAAYGAVYVITFLQQELGKERAVLPGNAGDKGFLHNVCFLL